MTANAQNPSRNYRALLPSGYAMTETVRPASLIVIGHNPGGGPVMPRVPLMLTGPAGPSAPHGPVAGKVSRTGWTSPGQDRSGLWLRNAAAGLCVLAAAAAAVSFTAQYRMVDAARHLPVVAPLEALIPAPPPWSSPVSASLSRCTAAGRCGPGR